MRCSSCEAHLDPYVEGWLSPARAAAVRAHLGGCDACETLHRRLRDVDGLLTTAGPTDLAGAFTDAVMVAVRDLPAPAARTISWVPLIAIVYLVGAWIAVAAGLAQRPDTFARAGSAIGALTTNVQLIAEWVHAGLAAQPLALPAVAAVLAVDVVLASLVIVFYRRVRPRLWSYLRTVEGR